MLSVVAIVFCALFTSANGPRNVIPEKSITKQLQEILLDNAIDVEQKDITARVLFKINLEGKIEIVRIHSKRKDVEWFLDRKLGGKRLKVSNDSYGEVFVVNVRVTS